MPSSTVQISQDPIAQHGTVRLATHAMGTRFELVLHGTDEPTLRAAGEDAIEAIEDAHRRLSRFEPGGPVFEMNRYAGCAAVPVDDEIRSLLTRCVAIREASVRSFDAVRSIGDGQAGSSVIEIGDHSVGLPSAETLIDLGGIAKGFALDLASEIVRDAGVCSALLHGGSSTIVALGTPPDADAWPITLVAGDEPRRIATAMLRDTAMSVSSQAGDRPGHVIDPATGAPAAGAQWAACIGDSAEATDAWATALIVRGQHLEGMPRALTGVLLDETGSRCVPTGPARACIVNH